MNTVLGYIRMWRELILGRVQPTSDGQRRYVRMFQAVTIGLAGRGLGIFINFISLPLTVSFLGPERYGMWTTITSTLAWLQIADLGLNNSLINSLAESHGKGNRKEAQAAVASAFWFLILVAALLLVIGGIVWAQLDWPVVFNVSSDLAQREAAPAVAMAGTFIILNIPLTIIARIYSAHQEGAVANKWTIVGNVGSFFGLILATQLQVGLVALVVAISGFQLLTSAISGLWLFTIHKPWLFPKVSLATCQRVKEMSRVGWQFLIVQLNGLMLFQTDKLIISQYLGAESVTPYDTAARLFNFTAVVPLMLNQALWPAYTEAATRGDGPWIRRTFRNNLLFGISYALVSAVMLLVFGQWFIGKWVGTVAVPSLNLIAWLGVWCFVSTAMASYASLLNALGKLHMQMYCGMLAALINIPLCIWLVGEHGIIGVPIATTTAYLICIVGPATAQIVFIIRSLSK